MIINLKKYVFLNNHEIPKRQWDDVKLRELVRFHILAIKKHLGRYHYKDSATFHEFTAYWLIYDLEALGKSKSAERIYIRLLALGIIEGI